MNTPREPYSTRDRASQHWCNAVGATVYCAKLDCPRCGDQEGDD